MPTRTHYTPDAATGRILKVVETTGVELDTGSEFVIRRNITVLDPEADAVGIQAGRARVAAESAALDTQEAELTEAQDAVAVPEKPTAEPVGP